MGRGRAKAKQTKVARQLKYNGGGGFDPTRLADELGGSSTSQSHPVSNSNGHAREDDTEQDDPYAKYAAMYDDEDDEDDEPGSDRHRP